MKRRFIGFLILLLCVTAGFLGVYRYLSSQAGSVTFQENILSGDHTLVEDLTLDLGYQHGDLDYYEDGDAKLLCWDVKLDLGDLSRTEVLAAQKTVRELNGGVDPEKEPFIRRVTGDPIQFWMPGSGRYILNDGAIPEGQDHDNLRDDDPFYDLIQDIASRTEKSQSRTETVRLAEYEAYWPVDIMLNGLGLYGQDEDAYEQALEDSFQYPVDPDFEMRVTVRLDDQGDLAAYELQPVRAGQPIPRWYSRCLLREDGIYFAVYTDTEVEGDANGFYFLPFYKVGAVNKVDVEGLRQLCAFADGESVHLDNMRMDEERLDVLSQAPGLLRTLRIDLKAQQVLAHSLVTEENFENYIWSEDLILLEHGDGSCTLMQEQPDGYEEVLHYMMTAEDPVTGASGNSHMAWNGETFYRLEFIDETTVDDPNKGPYTYRAGNSFYLSAYSADGRSYSGRYDCSLDHANMRSYRNRVEPIRTAWSF